MAEFFKVKIVTIDRELINVEAKSLKTKNRDGQFQILPNHSPLITLTAPARTEVIDKDDNKHVLFTSKGILKLNQNDLLMIVDTGEPKENIDVKRAEEALKRAEERLKDKKNIDVERALSSIERAKERIKTYEMD